ncbi:MAG: DUF4159 domain-containing protein [Candidatus Aureabacteria bacterium]|nr:DUF4159 domain-containing protein [Candidatus Auribacterota bacterium]
MINKLRIYRFLKKSFKEAPYLSSAILFHVIVLLVLGSIYIVRPVTDNALLSGKFLSKSTPIQKVDLRQLRKEMVQEVPVQMAKKLPVKKKTLEVQKVVEESLFKKQTAIKPELVKAETPKISSEREFVKRQEDRKQDYKDFVEKFELSGRGKTTKAKIQLSVARYAGGDWDCQFGGVINLIEQINRWTNIEANADILVRSVDSKEIFKAPFVYMTGHDNFTFTEEEVLNLRKYILKGGAVYCDNSLPGRRSRFDVAFRREMKRVLPDREFEEIDINHPVYSSFYSFNKLPKGMNWKNDTTEVIKVRDRIVVIYTLNDYGDLWTTGLNDKDEIDFNWYKGDDDNLYQRLGKWGDKVNYENVELESIKDAYKMGINVVVYLLLR